MSVEVLKPGLLATLEDLGRPGLAHLGIGRAGAFDASALAIANLLCGNPRGACGLEITLRGPTLRFTAAADIALTGAPLEATVDGVTAPPWAPVPIRAGAVLTLGRLRSGCRSYLAVRGGFDVPAVLGSRSCDLAARLGPLGGRGLAAGDRLPVGRAVPLPSPAGDRVRRWSLDPRPWHDADARIPLRLMPGSHLARLTAAARRSLFTETFHVQADSNRVGLRLAGPPLDWERPFELISEGCLPGVLQLPPSGQPIAFGPECPVSGGYPRIGQLAAVDLPRLAQLRPGDALRFAPCTLAEGRRAWAQRARALQQLERAIMARLHAHG